MISREVRHATGTYPIQVGHGIVHQLPRWLSAHATGAPVVVVADATVSALHPTLLPDVPRLTFAGGESHKTRETWMQLTDALLTHGADRDTVIVALGGGVTTDLAGFVAATALRGLRWVAAPTTTLAMLDASVGGKTGVDTSHGKNLVGAFHPPIAVVADIALLDTLPQALFVDGLAEVVKHAAIASRSHWEWIEQHAHAILSRDPTAVEQLVLDSVAIKAQVVEADEREAGRRAILNAGHTVAHGLEHASAYTMSHGHAVAIGLVAESRWAERHGIAERGTTDRVVTLLDRLGLPSSPPAGLDRARFLAALSHDKKNRDGQVQVAALQRIGEIAVTPDGRFTHPANPDDLGL